MQPAQLLQNLGVVGGVVKDPLVGGLGAVKLCKVSKSSA
jgi:hypothetical protein